MSEKIIYSVAEHGLRSTQIPEHARQVTETLQKAGFEAYVVGGGVRDQLLGLHPKDFDIATNAKPEQIKALFSNCILIGKRFRLAHIYFKRDIIEVATFRAGHAEATSDIANTRDGIITRDNVYGTLEEDALRRDFTINALYFNPQDESIIDFSGGMQDFQEKRIRLIGEPRNRYQEDPIRILRALRFVSKLNFALEENTERSIAEMVPLLAKMPAGRLFDEYIKLFLHGHGLNNFKQLRHYQAFQYLFPKAALYVEAEPYKKLFAMALSNTDMRVLEGKSINPAFLIAVFLWPVLQDQLNLPAPEANSLIEAFNYHMAITVSQQLRHTAMPKKFSGAVKEIWGLQRPMQQRKSKQIDKILSHPRFRAAYDFLLLRMNIGEVKPDIFAWWTDIQLLDREQRALAIKALRHNGNSKEFMSK